jgi:hypothetical protein
MNPHTSLDAVQESTVAMPPSPIARFNTTMPSREAACLDAQPKEKYLTLQLHKKSEKKEVKSLRRPVDCGYKEIVYQTINPIQEATASEIQ